MKHILQSTLEDIGYVPRDYSGRGMMGKTCLGISTPLDGSVGDIFADIIEHIRNESRGSFLDIVDVFLDIAEAFRDMRQDSLGKGSIIYFPNIEFTEDD